MVTDRAWWCLFHSAHGLRGVSGRGLALLRELRQPQGFHCGHPQHVFGSGLFVASHLAGEGQGSEVLLHALRSILVLAERVFDPFMQGNGAPRQSTRRNNDERPAYVPDRARVGEDCLSRADGCRSRLGGHRQGRPMPDQLCPRESGQARGDLRGGQVYGLLRVWRSVSVHPRISAAQPLNSDAGVIMIFFWTSSAGATSIRRD